MLNELKARIASHRQEILDFTTALIRIPTENPPGIAYEECARALRERLSSLGFQLQARVPGPCVQAVLGRGRRTIHFHGHFDVVPAASPAQFQPATEDGKLIGRGSSDMKAGLAAMVYAAVALRECGIELDGRISLTFVPDEETGGMRGSRLLITRRWLGKGAAGMLTPEPTGGAIWNTSRGAVSLRVTVHGRPAHVGLAHAGSNAFEHMIAVAQRLLQLKKKVALRKTRYSIRPEAARRSILMMGGRCEGGTNFNTVPADCSFTIDRRTNPEEDLATEKRQLLEVLAGLRRGGIEMDIQILQEGEPSATAADHPMAIALAKSVREVTRETPRFEMCPGLLETRFYSRAQVPALAYGPGLLTVSHGPREFVPVQNIHDCALVYALTAARFLRRERRRLGH